MRLEREAPDRPDTTKLYASDRDVFLFLVDDIHPIEAGRLPNGGSKTLGIASFFLRAAYMNRNIWGCGRQTLLVANVISLCPTVAAI